MRPQRPKAARTSAAIGFLLCALVCAPLAAQTPAPSSSGFDPFYTRFGFELRTRWGQKVEGAFPSYEGEVAVLPDGRHQVRIALATGAVQVGDSTRYTELARGRRFFDSARFPRIEFLSEPHPADLVRAGGKLRGRLTLHGVSRMETFVLAPSTCLRPGKDCDVLAHGSVSRDDYGLDGWQLALSDRVRFTLRVRLKNDLAGSAAP